jgi:hypothetical protein
MLLHAVARILQTRSEWAEADRRAAHVSRAATVLRRGRHRSADAAPRRARAAWCAHLILKMRVEMLSFIRSPVGHVALAKGHGGKGR